MANWYFDIEFTKFSILLPFLLHTFLIDVFAEVVKHINDKNLIFLFHDHEYTIFIHDKNNRS